jgi:hypothetical protein
MFGGLSVGITGFSAMSLHPQIDGTETRLSMIRKLIRHLFLRGFIQKLWITRKDNKEDLQYFKFLADTKMPVRERERKPVVHSGNNIRRILFIADCMWEHGQLIPGLNKIAATQVLDLNPLLKAEQAFKAPNLIVEEIVEEYTKDQKFDFDLILLYVRPGLIGSGLFDLLRARWSCPIFGMNLDDKSQFFPLDTAKPQRAYARWAGKFDLNLSSTRGASDWYAEIGAPYYFLGMGFHPPSPSRQSSTIISSISFVGSCRHERENLVRKVGELGVPVDTYGQGWKNSKGWIDDASTVYRDSQLNLGIGYSGSNSKLTSLKARDYECPGVGGCYITTYNWELAMEFHVGKEILCYRDAEELAEMYFWWIKRPDLCQQIASMGQKRALNEYTWEKRFRTLFASCGFVSDKVAS